MLKKYLIKIFFVISSLTLFSQTSTLPNISDTNLTFYDYIYLKNLSDKQQIVINQLNKKVAIYQTKVYKMQQTVSLLNDKINLYKDLYANLLRAIFVLKQNISSTFLFIFSSKTINQMIARYNYYKFLTFYVKNLSQYIALLNNELAENQKVLKLYKQSLSMAQLNFQNNQVEYDQTLALLLQQSKIMKQNAKKIRITINNTYKEYEIISKTIKNFSHEDKGAVEFRNLISPLQNAVVISSYGVHSHPDLKYVKIKNDGVDLFSKTDTIVKVVSNGIVVRVLKLPERGSSIIVKHGEFYTVYSNMNLIYVSENDTIFQAQKLGTISKKTSKYSFPCLNFQVWQNSEKKNPADFIKFD